MKSGGSANQGAQAPKDSKEKTTGSGNNSALQSKGGQSSRQSSQGSIGDMGRGGGMYQDETKLLAAVKLYSTLDDSGFEALELKNKYDSKQSYQTKTSAAGHQKQNKNILLRIERQILDKLFIINHIVLSNQGVTVFLYHIILFLTFIQILFNIFYKVQITNEFSPEKTTHNVSNTSTTSTIFNTTNTTHQASGGNFLSSLPPRFRVDDYFIWINFQFYVMRQNSETQFIMLYSIISGVFILFLIFLILISGRVFQSSKTEDVKEGTKLLLKGVSILMCLYILLLQIPMQTLILQGFLCNEGDSEGEELTIKSIQCDSLTHKLLTVASIFLLILFTGFNIFQQILYTSNSFEIIVPWGSYERVLATFRVIIKLVISIGFIFDKKGAYRGEVNLVLFFLQSFVVIRRYQDCIIFETSVLYATVLYEGINLWLYITVSIHILSDTPLTVTTFALLIVTGIFFAIILAWLQFRQKMTFVSAQQNFSRYTKPLEFMIYIFHVYELIESTDPQDHIIMEGKLRYHLQMCEKDGCPCLSIIESLDETKKYKKIKQKEEEEENQMLMIQKQNEIDQAAFNFSMAHEMQESNNFQTSLRESGDTANHQDFNIQQANSRKGNNSSSQLAGKNYSINRKKSQKHIQTSPDKSPSGQSNSKSWLQNKKKMKNIEEKFNQMFETVQDRKKEKKQWYRLLSIMISQAIERFPKHVDLKIINAYVQKSKLNNEFKAIFEMMNCELCQPNIHEQFMIFRKKIEVEQTLLREYQKNSTKPGTLDVVNVFKYERIFQKYQLYEYMTTFSAQCFWRELLQKQINAQVLQEKGSQISKYYEIIQDINQQLTAIYPEEIKFMWRYGNFLLHIIHNEYDAQENFRRAITIFFSRITKKGNGMTANEQTIFGENSASAIIIISATSSSIGTVIHANEELEVVLGYKRKELIGRNITMIIPRPIAKAHDKLIQRYFETAKPTVIEIKRQLLAANKDGYLREIELIVKVFPQVDDRIVFVGFIQRNDRFDDMEPVKPEFEKYDKQYMITDVEGNITNVTEGLNIELGLHAKFFQYTDSIFQQMFHLKKICPDIFEPDLAESLENEGAIVMIDTRNILNNIELESLTSDEILEVRSNLGQYNAYVQQKKLVIHAQYCTIHIYRIIIVSKHNDASNSLGRVMISNLVGSLGENAAQLHQGESDFDENGSHQSMGSAVLLSEHRGSMSSMSSTQSGSVSFNRFIKDFKKALGERKTPKNLIYLNQVIKVILIITIILSSVDYAIHRTQVEELQIEQKQNLFSEERTLKEALLASNVRSYINVANGLEFDNYEGISISPIDRFEYLSRLIQKQAQDLSEIHEAISLKRTIQGQESDVRKQNDFEYELIDLFRLDDSDYVSNYSQPYRVSLMTYLNMILQINSTDRALIQIPQNFIINAPKLKNGFIMKSNQTTQSQKAAYFIMVNGLRDLRTKTLNATLFRQDNGFGSVNKHSIPYLAIMIAGTVISLISIFVLLQQIYTIELNKAEILSLYALLSFSEIQKVFYECDDYMQMLEEGSVVRAIKQEGEEQNDFESNMLGGETDQQMQGLASNKIGSQMSEDDREAEIQRQLIEKKKAKGGKKGIKKRVGSMFAGQDIYLAMVRKTQDQMRDLTMTKSGDKALTPGLKKTSSVADNGTSKTRMHKSHSKKHQEKSQKIKTQPSQTNIKEGGKHRKGGKKKKIIKIEQEEEIFEEKKKNQDQDHHKHESSSEDSQTHSEEDTEERIKRKKKEREERKKEEEIRIRGIMDMSNDEVEERKKQFYKTIKSKNWGKIVFSSIIGIIFTAYFVQLYVYNQSFEQQLNKFTALIPIFFNRYRYSILGYTFIRERIINNNTLDSFEYDPQYGYNLDQMYIDRSMQIEKELTSLKTDSSSVNADLVSLIQVLDSENFCNKIIGDTSENQTTILDSFAEPKYIPTGIKPYEFLVNTAFQAYRAMENGDLVTLQNLKTKRGLDLQQINYDRRTFLHIAAKNGQLEIVKFLVSQGVQVNQQDRWKATALNYAAEYPKIASFLQSVGGQIFTNQDDYQLLASVYQNKNITENDYRSLLSAFYGDLNSLQELRAQGILQQTAQDKDGRTPLAIAASEGNIDAVKYLIKYEANMAIRDARNNDALSDARREGRANVVNYLSTIISEEMIHQHCNDFADGLFRKGVQQAIGNFHKRFADLAIKVSSTTNYGSLLSLLGAPQSTTKPFMQKGTTQFNVSSFQTFFTAQELYFNQAIEKAINITETTYSSSTSSFKAVSETIFLIFVIFQLIILLFLRSKLIDTMREDIFQSRGILNLIPDNFFEQNRSRVEKLIKKLKD